MTTIAPRTTPARPTLVIDLDTCVGCHAWSIACKNASATEPLADTVWPNQVFSYELDDGAVGRTLHVPRMCQHCETPECVVVCPTGASNRRPADGVVMIDELRCIGCRLCVWACPYGAREHDEQPGVVRKCTLCFGRREDDGGVPACVTACPTGARQFGNLTDPDSALSDLVSRRGGFGLLPEIGSGPAVRYLPPRPSVAAPAPMTRANSVRFWTNRPLSR